MNEPEKPKKVKLCHCGTPIKFWRNAECDECLAVAGKEPERKKRRARQSVSEPVPKEPVMAETVPNERVSKRGILGEGAPTKKTEELLAAVLEDMSLGMSEAQACGGHDIRPETFSRWKNLPEYESLRAKAQFCRLKGLLAKMEAEPGDWRKWAWQLERGQYRIQFGDPAKIGVQVNQQFNGSGNPGMSQEALEETRKRLDKIELWRAHWKAGTATNAELRDCMVRQRDEAQHVIECLDAGETPDQEEQQRLYRDHEEKSEQRQPSPIREAVGRVVGSGDPLAIMDSEPELAPRPQDHSMQARDMDPSSGLSESAEPPIRQRDRPQPIGPLSERQQRLVQQRRSGRDDGSGKNPW
jgi:hypothetical protein